MPGGGVFGSEGVAADGGVLVDAKGTDPVLPRRREGAEIVSCSVLGGGKGSIWREMMYLVRS